MPGFYFIIMMAVIQIAVLLSKDEYDINNISISVNFDEPVLYI